MKVIQHSCKGPALPLSCAPDCARPIFIDIETTGLSRAHSRVYLVGTVSPLSGEEWQVCQWFAESPMDERTVLSAAANYCYGADLLIHFNGDSFDLPFLAARCEEYGIAHPFFTAGSLDIYRHVRSCRGMLSLSSCRQKAVEVFLGMKREDRYHGGQLIDVYHRYVRCPSEELLRLLLLHNDEDICSLPLLLPMLDYADLRDGKLFDDSPLRFREETDSRGQERIRMDFALSRTLPRPARFSVLCYDFSLSGSSMSMSCPVTKGTLKFFFPDYQNYYYLPEEDEAIHKSVSSYVDKNFREQARADTCYTKKTGRFIPVPADSAGPLFYVSYRGQAFRPVEAALSDDASVWRAAAVRLMQLI